MARQVRAVLTVLLLLAVGFGQGVSALAAIHLDVAHSGASQWGVESRVSDVSTAAHHHAAGSFHHHANHASDSIADAGVPATGHMPGQGDDGPDSGKSGYAGPHCCTSLIFLAPSSNTALVPSHSGLRHVICSTSVAPDNMTYPLLRPPRHHA